MDHILAPSKRRDVHALRARLAADKAEADAAKERTAQLLANAAAVRREAKLKEEYLEKMDQGAPNSGVDYEVLLHACINDALPGDKICLPVSVLAALAGNPDVHYPLMFELVAATNRTHCGVLEFTAPEGEILLSEKVAHCLGKTVDLVRIRYKHLTKCEGITLAVGDNAETTDNIKRILEAGLRQYVTISTGDEFVVSGHLFSVIGVKPESACCLIDADVDLEIVGKASEKWQVGQSHVVNRGKLEKIYCHNGGHSALLVSAEKPHVITVSVPGKFEFINNTVRVDLDSDVEAVWVGVEEGESVIVSAKWEGEETGLVKCDNCSQMVGQNAMDMHRIRCDKVVYRNCMECQERYKSNEEEQHIQRWHREIVCNCGTTLRRFEMVNHQKRECETHNILCRFCRLEFPRGKIAEMDARDRIMGFRSTHEAQCGNRTDNCDICGRPEKLKDMDIHMKAFHH